MKADRVSETTSTTGTGTLTLAGARLGYQSFANAGLDGQTLTYCVSVPSGAWEVTDGVFNAGAGTLTRGQFRSSSTGSRINLPSGTKTVDYVFSASDVARIGNFVDVANAATGGDGSSGNPWTGTESISWSAFTEYRMRSGHYRWDSAPNFAHDELHLIAEAGVFIRPHFRGNALTIDNGGTISSPFSCSITLENINIIGYCPAGSGTISFNSATATVTGVGTAFLTEVAVGDAISIGGGTANVESRIVTVITDDTHLTVDSDWSQSLSGATYNIGQTTNGFFLRDAAISRFIDCSARDINSAGFWLEDLSFNFFDTPTVTIDNSLGYHQYFTVKPRYGMVLDTSTPGNQAGDTTRTVVINGSFDSVTTYGIWVRAQAWGNRFVGSASESNCKNGLSVQPGSPHAIFVEGYGNTFSDMELESNQNADYYITGYSNQVSNGISTGTSTLPVASSFNLFSGGQFGGISNVGNDNTFVGIACNLTSGGGSGTFVDTGARTSTIASCDINGNIKNKLGSASVFPLDISNDNPGDALKANIFAFGVSGDFTIQNFTHPSAGQLVYIHLIVGGAGNFALSWGNQFRAQNGGSLPNTTGAAGDVVYKIMRDYSNSYWIVGT